MQATELYMQRCLELAQLAKGHTAPNPMVGAVLVHQGRIIGEGWHMLYGQAHAEVNCLDSVAHADKHLIPESAMYVSLEPCAHVGKTPPCATRVAAEKVKQVIICNRDPFDKVSGRGIQILQHNHIEVTTGILEAQGLWMNRRFFCFHQKQRPYIILKWAQTAQGYMAPADGSRIQISNNHAHQLVHKWRTEESAIMVGYNTAVNDNPQLTARLWKGNQPLRIVLDRNLSLPENMQLFNADADTWIVNEQKQFVNGNLRYVQLAFDANMLHNLMGLLHTAGKLSIIIEGGRQLLDSFINAGLWDEARVFYAQANISNGMPAPTLTHSLEVMSTDIRDNTLKLFTHKNTAYPYVAGMEL